MAHYTNAATERVVLARIDADRRAQIDAAAIRHLATLPADKMLQAIAKAYDEGARN